ncbi:AlwI family type II restriction endonuclease [Weissella sp. LMG 11983]|uniref:AlwI family type II restriction endonuclease n=1 Tax=Weissella sp. LMG 11983 TaxID=2987700 RepID=UPI0021F85B8E|nr:AlwI family type II restriction endonuclease [Weissella sp. LMG 11983]MCW0925959.1 AlwI family type II restriction endonuclease [Weissella sp. LMG 11983]
METTFNWRTAPRSITRLIDWLPYFDKFQNEDYQLVVPNQNPDTSKSFKNLRPTRRAIRYAFESDLDFPDKLVTIPYQDFLKGKQPDGDTADKESIVRQVVTTAEQYGFMDASNANLTPVGRRIVDGTFNAEDFLAQLLKMYIVVDGEGVFPIKTVIKLIAKFGYISRNEMTFIFGQIHDSDYKTTEKAVSDFRHRYADLPARNDTKAVEDLVEDVWNTYLPPVPTKKIKSILKDYTDALRRSLEFTEMFYSHGRGTATKLRVSELNQTKFKQLVEKYTFVTPPLQVIKGESVQLGSRILWSGMVRLEM